jgi:hypothetical protein
LLVEQQRAAVRGEAGGVYLRLRSEKELLGARAAHRLAVEAGLRLACRVEDDVLSVRADERADVDARVEREA